MTSWIAVFLGGGFGSLCRFGISRISFPFYNDFPLATLVANILASAILGFTSTYFLVKSPNLPLWKLFLATGFCGGFSTFSTFSLEMFSMLQEGKTFIALVYLFLSVGVCLFATALGMALAMKS